MTLIANIFKFVSLVFMRFISVLYMGILTKILGDPNEKILKKMQPIINEINGLEKKFEKMSDQELKGMTDEFRKRMGIDEVDENLTGWPRRRLTHPRNDSDLKLDVAESLGSSRHSDKVGAPQDNNAVLDQILPEAFAVVREASKRANKQRHYDVQLMGGIVLHRGQITEMKTGEGKTLVATLPLYLNALTKRSEERRVGKECRSRWSP